jgi:hypothetical protein
MRNDRTPLNTPCTPAVVKLQLRRQGEQDAAKEATSPARALVATIRASAFHLLLPLRYVRYVSLRAFMFCADAFDVLFGSMHRSLVDRVIARLLPRMIVQSAIFTRVRSLSCLRDDGSLSVSLLWLSTVDGSCGT